jgi:hypothetical protein
MVQERQIICFSWKWLGEKQVHALALPMFKSYRKDRNDNRALIRKLHELISQADIVIGHNVASFDDKMANTDFIVNGLPPPPPHKTIDTLKVARSRFRFNSNKLDDLGARLGLGRKVQHRGFNMWLGCLNGEAKSWAEMVKYCVGDVALLEKVYLKLRPWMTNHPGLNFDGNVGCPSCRSKKMERRGWTKNKNGRKQRYQCQDCSSWATGQTVKEVFRFS